jgi:hypothetical protein
MIAQNPTNSDIESLWSAALEMFFHQLLYARRLYPKETFTSARFLGAQCKVNRHQDVVSYISEAVEVAIPALFDGVCNEVSLEIFDYGNSSLREKYVLRLSKKPSKTNYDCIPTIEREMQYLILSVYSLERESYSWRSSSTFKINLFVSGNEQKCTDLNNALGTGKWFCPFTDTEQTRTEEKRCPVYDMKLCSASFSFSSKK